MQIRCKWCPCTFLTLEDFNAHMERFGINKKNHERKWSAEMWRRKREHPK